MEVNPRKGYAMKSSKYAGFLDVRDPINSNNNFESGKTKKESLTLEAFRTMIIDAYKQAASIDSYDIDKTSSEGKNKKEESRAN